MAQVLEFDAELVNGGKDHHPPWFGASLQLESCGADRPSIPAPPGHMFYGEAFWADGRYGIYVTYFQLITGEPVMMALVGFGNQTNLDLQLAKDHLEQVTAERSVGFA